MDWCAIGNVFSPASGDGREGKNKLSLGFWGVFSMCRQCWSNHTEACRFEETAEGCLSGTTAVIILLWQCRQVVDLCELTWQNEQRVRDAWGSLSLMWNPFVEQYRTESHPDIHSFMCLLSVHPSAFHPCQMTMIGLFVIWQTWIIYTTSLNSYQRVGAKKGQAEAREALQLKRINEGCT